MSRRIIQRKRHAIQDSGKASTDLPFYVGRGSLSIAGALLVLCVMIGAIQKKNQVAVAETQPENATNTELLPSLLPMTLEELLIEMGKRLSFDKVTSKVRLEQRTLRVMAEGPMFPLSKETLAMSKESQLEAVADTLAWAVHCHLRFTGALASHAGREALQQCGLVNSERYSCIPGKGRVDVAGIRFEGHADSLPFRQLRAGEQLSRKFNNNQELSDARALVFASKVVKCAQSKLSKLGAVVEIPHETRGFSDSFPGESDGKDPKNRRVEIHFDESGKDAPLLR